MALSYTTLDGRGDSTTESNDDDLESDQACQHALASRRISPGADRRRATKNDSFTFFFFVRAMITLKTSGLFLPTKVVCARTTSEGNQPLWHADFF